MKSMHELICTTVQEVYRKNAADSSLPLYARDMDIIYEVTDFVYQHGMSSTAIELRNYLFAYLQSYHGVESLYQRDHDFINQLIHELATRGMIDDGGYIKQDQRYIAFCASIFAASAIILFILIKIIN
ncbi:MAG: hypothetical protein LAT57_00210 [Balneolales bacterium]|nr:hypothetical protein [Balneolales bacterium]